MSLAINWNGNRPAGIDFETTGLQPGWHEIIQVGIAPMSDALEPPALEECFYEYIRPEHPERQDPEAAAVHGIDMEWLMDTAPSASEVADWLHEWFQSHNFPEGRKFVPIAHNWPFENGFLDAWIGSYHKEQLFHYHARDTAPVVGYLRDKNIPGVSEHLVSLSLGAVCNVFGVPNDRPHDALSDALACAELYRRLVDH